MLFAIIIWETLFRFMAKKSRMGSLLLTLGDAIEPFLENQDETTEGVSTFSKCDFEYQACLPTLLSPRARAHDDDTRHTWATVSRLIWMTYDFLIVFVFIGIIIPWGILVANHDTISSDMSITNMFRTEQTKPHFTTQ